jgi:hypothetical protein
MGRGFISFGGAQGHAGLLTSRGSQRVTTPLRSWFVALIARVVRADAGLAIPAFG